MSKQARSEEEPEDEQEDEHQAEPVNDQDISTMILERCILPKVWDDSKNAMPFSTL